MARTHCGDSPCGQGLCYADYPAGLKGSLHTRKAAAAVVETTTDFDRPVYSGKYAGCSVQMKSHVTIVAGNEDVDDNLYSRKLVHKFVVENDPHNENAWQHVDPNDIRIDYPGQAPREVPPLGRVGRVAKEPSPNADYYTVLRTWRRANLPDLTICRALFSQGSVLCILMCEL
jgi:hypothetical protein